MVASTSVALSKESDKGFIEYYRGVQALQNITRDSQRARFEKADRSYQRETDLSEEQTRAKAANAAGDPTKFQNMTVPVVMPQVEAAVVHQTSVFLTGFPLLGVTASPQFIDEALQMQTILEDQSIKGGWARELILFFRDGFKHNFAPLEIDWKEEISYAVETNLEKNLTKGTPKKVIWSGNRIRRLDPYNTFVDTRVPPTDVHKDGEFAGFTELMTRIKLKTFIASLPDKIIRNIIPALESGLGGNVGASNSGAMNYYVPSINPLVPEEDYKGAGTNWLKWAGISTSKRTTAIDYKESYEVTTLYARVLPSEFSLHVPNKETPQIYKLIIVNHEHIIYAEQQTNAHNFLPIIIGQPLEDGLGYQTKSLAKNGEPFQDLATSYMGSIIASRRRAISDRLLYDPSRVTAAAINSPNPSAKIPVRPAAYGKNLGDAVHHFEYREDQAASSMQQISTLLGLANTLNGQNQVTQGQFQKGNKTLHEFESVMQNANGRDQLAAILLEFQCFVPMKEILKLNILQFQGGTTIYNRDKKVSVEIDPVKLRAAVMEFKVSDGLIPTDKIIGGDAIAVALQAFASPEIASGYNVPQVFSYFMKTQGAEIGDFEKSPEQLAYEQALGAWQGLTQLAIEKGIDPATLGLGARPLPQEFNYDPAANKPAPETTQAQATSPETTSQEVQQPGPQ